MYPTALRMSSATVLLGCFLLFLAIVVFLSNHSFLQPFYCSKAPSKNATAISYRSIVAYVLSLLYRNCHFPLPRAKAFLCDNFRLHSPYLELFSCILNLGLTILFIRLHNNKCIKMRKITSKIVFVVGFM